MTISSPSEPGLPITPAPDAGRGLLGARQVRPDTFGFTLLLGLLAALPALSIDISQPTLLSLQAEFLASPRTIGLTLTLFMIGFAAGQFGAGPLSDHYGRRPVLLTALACYSLTALGCALAGTAEALLALRLLQGAAAGGCAVLAFAMIRDLFVGDAARAKRSYVTIVFGLAPMLAPSVGAWMLDQWGWRPIYLALCVSGLLLLAVVMTGVAESRLAPSTTSLRPRLRSAYLRVLSDRRFSALCAMNALSYGAVFAYIAGSPQVLMHHFGLSPGGYGVVFACTAAALTLGAYASGWSVRLGIGPRRLLWNCLAASAASAALLAVLIAADVTPWALFPLLLLHLFCRGVIGPNAQHVALDPMGGQAGTAAAAIGVIQILMGALSSACVALLLPMLGPAATTSVMAAFAVASLVMWGWVAWSPVRMS